MDSMIDGYRRFLAQSWPARRALFRDLADNGQNPRTMVIACADSRVDPGMIFDAEPGEIFTIRNVANIVPPYAPDGGQHATSAALEFGVRVLKITDLVVMGHAMCGGIHALLTGAPSEASDFFAPWIDVARAVRAAALQCSDPAEAQERAEHDVVRLSLENLLTFPWIAEPASAGTLRLHGMRFDIRSGTLEILHPDGAFRRV